MEQKLDRWLLAGAGLSVALLIVNVALTFANTQRLHQENARVSHTHTVIAGLEKVFSLAREAESANRGFLITGEPTYLEPFDAAVAAIGNQADEVERLTSDNPRQLSRVPELRRRIADRFAWLERGIALRKSDGFDAAKQIVASGLGRSEMEALRATVSEMIAHERNLLAVRSRASEQTYRAAISTGLLSGLAALAAIGAFLYLLQRHLRSRAQAAAAIAEQRERLRTTLASIGDAVITTDVAGRVVNMNAVAESLTGWSNAEANGRPLDEVFRIVNETSREPVRSPAARALAEGAIVGLANHTVLISKDGVERPIDDSAAPIRCREGAVVGCVLVFRDVTERRRAEAALQESESLYRTLFNSIDEGFCIIEMLFDERQRPLDYRFLQVSPSFQAQTGISDAVGKTIRELHPRHEQRWFEVYGEIAMTGKPARFQDFASQLNRWFDVYAFRVGPPERRQVAVLFKDITDQRRMEDELRQYAAELSEADRRKDEFLAVLAHELRNPLAPLRNGLEIMRLAGGGGDAAERARVMMDRQLGQMVRLVDDLLDVSRISRGKLELRKERVALDEVLNDAVETSRPVIESRGHELVVATPSEPIFLDADATRLAQAFANLLNNAAKYSDPGGQIALTAERQGEEVVVRVKDGGIGIPPEMLPKVFDLFTQVDRSLEKSQGGLGIGLTLVKRLVELHGGRVEAKSDGPGKGSEFVVRLPVWKDEGGRMKDGSHETPTHPPSFRPPPSGSRRILIADDNADSAISLAMMLRFMGHDVRTASDGAQAAEAAEEFRPDLALLDIGMPKLNGYEVCRRIREHSWGKSVFLVALTGWGQEEDRRRSAEAGFDRHLVKPVSPATLEKLLAELKTER